ncbi:MAG: sigma factor-like helix-turn-helix DNA-binding protein [Pseudomonadota bacterium]
MAHREERLSLAEIGRDFRISRERIRQIEAGAVRKSRLALSRSPVHDRYQGIIDILASLVHRRFGDAFREKKARGMQGELRLVVDIISVRGLD